MNEPIHALVALEFALTAVIVFKLIVAAAITVTTSATPWAIVRSARMLTLTLFASTVVGALLHRALTTDWVHFSWSLRNPLLGLFVGSGAFLCSLWHHERSDEAECAERPTDLSRNGLWFVAAMLSVAFLSVALQWLIPDPAPPQRANGRPLAGLVEIAAYGLGRGDVPALLVPSTPQGEVRGLGYLTRELSVPLGVVCLASLATIAYAALGLTLRCLPAGAPRRALLLVGPMIATALLGSDLATLDAMHWGSDPAFIRSFGPTVAAAFAAVAILVAAVGADRWPTGRSTETGSPRPRRSARCRS